VKRRLIELKSSFVGDLLATNGSFVGNKVMVCWQQTFLCLYADGNQWFAKGVFCQYFRLAKLWCKDSK
jgi:hypothetical protein